MYLVQNNKEYNKVLKSIVKIFKIFENSEAGKNRTTTDIFKANK